MSREVARVVVDVMLKPEILDPQGSAILGALPRLGFDEVTAVRQGKHFELEVAEPVDEARLHELADTLLANTVIEEFTVRVVRGPADALPAAEARGAADALPAAEARGAADALPSAEARGAADALPSAEARGAADALPAAEARGADALPSAEARK